MTDGIGWRDVKIGSLGRVVTGKTPPSARPELFGEAHPFITPTDIDGVSRTVVTERFIAEEGASAFKNQMIPGGAVCFVCIGATIGKMCIATCRSLTNQQVNSIIVDEASHDPRYVFYALRQIAPDVKGLAGGAATPIISKSSFSDISIRVAPLQQQRRIAAILSAYDDLIENNTRRIAILEEMARRIYEEWFVRFRYPGHGGVRVVESELGPVPEGWGVATVDEVMTTLGGGTPSKAEPAYWDSGDINWYAPTDLTGAKTVFMEESASKITSLGLEKSSARRFPVRSVMMTSRATLGVIAVNTTEACTNQGFIICIPSGQYPLWLLYHWLKANAEKFESLATGATFKEITKGVFRQIKLLVPPTTLADRFEQTVGSMMELVLRLERANRNLRTTRDLLLPKLTSGELDVSELPLPEAIAA